MTAATRVALLIPAYRPGAELEEVVRQTLILDHTGLIEAVVIVDDGSVRENYGVLNRVAAMERVVLLRHAVNLGKGAALKTGFNHILVNMPQVTGIVTADADGQHAPEDILHVAALLATKPDRLVLGVREFSSGVPLRSRFGNTLTRGIFTLFTGMRLRDTQTGLRGWPLELARQSLRVPIQGYDFEFEALIGARGREVEETPIRTIYHDGNRGSHFNPLLDSMRIYFVFARYCGSALMAAALDSFVFTLAYARTSDLMTSQMIGRGAALCVMFFILRSLVFRSDVAARLAFAKYVVLVALSGWVSYGLIGLLRDLTQIPVLWAKLIAEGLLFIGNFAIQREFIFTQRAAE